MNYYCMIHNLQHVYYVSIFILFEYVFNNFYFNYWFYDYLKFIIMWLGYVVVNDLVVYFKLYCSWLNFMKCH